MHKFGLGAAILSAGLLIGVQAYAADIPYKAPPAPAPMLSPAPVATWTGFYVGANVGYGWANVGVEGASSDLSGIIGGGQVGYNYQMGQWVLGVEGDFQASAESRSDSASVLGITFTVDQKIRWFGTLRGRLGYAFNSVMIYATGGAAWQNYELSVSALGASASDDTTNLGWTVGAGVEWMFAPQWSVKGEYLYMDTGDTDATLFGATFSGRAKNSIARVGVNYHFR